MSFLDDSPELAADLRDVFNILYPPSPSNTQDDWEDAEANSSTLAVSNEGAGEIVDLDGPVDDLAPLDVHERSAGDVAHEPTSESKFPGYVESLLGKLSRKRVRAILDTTLPLIGHASPDLEEKKIKKRRFIEMIQPGIQVPERLRSDVSTPIRRRYSSHNVVTAGSSAKRDRRRSSTSTATEQNSDSSLYNPFSALSYLSRLRTFSLTTYSSKSSDLLSPQACSQAGWINQGGKDRLFCQVCRKAWRVEMPTENVVGGIRLAAAFKRKYIRLLAEQLVLAHSPSCPWRVRQCPPTIHQDLLLLNPPISSHLASSAFELELHILAKGETPSIAHFEEADFELVSPLSTTETDCLTKNLNLALEDDPTSSGAEQSGSKFADMAHRNHATSSMPISSTAAVLTFFGWTVLRPGQPDLVTEERSARSTGDMNAGPIVPDVLHCRICDRKIGLWAFRQTPRSVEGDTTNASPKALDVLLEHREFCPIRTLAGNTDEARAPWWREAAILHESPFDEGLAVTGHNDSNAHLERGGGPGMREDKSSLGNVVDVLKKFTRSDHV